MSAIQVQRAKNLLRDLLRDRLKLSCLIHPWVMVCIHSTYYIKIHLLCNIRDSVQAAGGLDSSILWPGKLWKTIVFQANKARPIPGRSDHFYHCGKGQNQLIFYPIGTVPHCIPGKNEPALRICTNNSGSLASCGPAAEKISGAVNPAHFFGFLFSPVRIMFDL